MEKMELVLLKYEVMFDRYSKREYLTTFYTKIIKTLVCKQEQFLLSGNG